MNWLWLHAASVHGASSAKFWIPLLIKIEPLHEISNNVVCAISKAADQPAHTRSLIRALAIRSNIQ